MSDTMKLWNDVCKTNPKHTKGANVRGNKITAVAPQTQIMAATEQWGPYGMAWGFKAINLDYSLITEFKVVVFKGDFFCPSGDFQIISSIKMYTDNAQTKVDADFAKKIETDALTKALSKMGFNADVFMGLYDDHKYVADMKAEFAAAENPNIAFINDMIIAKDVAGVKCNWGELITENWSALSNSQTEDLNHLYNQLDAPK
jgi:hypothetical protein